MSPLDFVIRKQQLDFSHEFLLLLSNFTVLVREAASDISEQDVGFLDLLVRISNFLVKQLVDHGGLLLKPLLTVGQQVVNLFDSRTHMLELLAYFLLQLFLKFIKVPSDELVCDRVALLAPLLFCL